MRRRHHALFAAATLLVAGSLVNGNISDCAYKCFQDAVNDNGCAGWLSDSDCCFADEFLGQIAECLPESCSKVSGLEAWEHLRGECSSAGVEISYDYEEVQSLQREGFPSGPRPTTAPVFTDSDGEILPLTASLSSTPSTSIDFYATITSSSTSRDIYTTPTSTSTSTADKQFEFESSDESSEGGSKLSAGYIVLIVLVVVGVVLFALLFAFYWRRKRKRSSSSPAKILPPETTPEEVYEISGTEIPRSNYDRYQLQELDATDSEIWAPGFPKTDRDSAFSVRLSQPGRNSESIHGRNEHMVGELDASAECARSPDQQRVNSGPNLSGAPMVAVNTDTITPAVSPSSQLSPPGNSLSPDLSSRRVSAIETPISVNADENQEVESLLSSLADVERRRQERASRLQLLQEEEMVMRAEETALLEEIQKRVNN